MFDPATNGVKLSRDVNWLRRKFSPDSQVLEAGGGVEAIDLSRRTTEAVMMTRESLRPADEDHR
jgi:hypothetical protein